LAEEAGEHKPKGEARKEKRVVWLLPPLLIGCALSLKCIYFKPFNLLWFGGKKRQQRRAMSYLKTTWTAKRRNSSRLLPRGVMHCFQYHVVLPIYGYKFHQKSLCCSLVLSPHEFSGCW